MPLRNSQPYRFSPQSLCDAVDGTNTSPGAMASLANLVPDPTTRGVYVPRPAAELEATLRLAGAGVISNFIVIGDLAYGLVASSRTAGKDEPFVYDLASGTLLTVTGITASNVPPTQATAGEWTPPILAQVGSRIIVTHPGFPGGTVKFGWFDVSSFSATTTGNTHTSTLIDGNPTVLGLQPGLTITGVGIPANTTVVSTAEFTRVTTGDTHTNTTLDNLANVTGVAIGQTVQGAGIPAGTTVSNIVGTTVTLSQAATATTVGVSVTFSGATITLSAATTASANGITLTIAGGTKAAPLWGAGDTDRNNLPSVPVGVAQFNGRAYFALGTDGIVYSDSGFPCRVSNSLAVQALTTNDGLAVTALGPLMLSAPLTGGIVQAIIAFEGPYRMQQIVGDQATSNLSMNLLPVATGTSAPMTIAPTQKGLAFVSPHGLRFVKFDGTVTDPIGEGGIGVAVPFQNALYPSRMCAAANNDLLRISCQRGDTDAQPWREYWYDLTRLIWSGPHTFPARCMAGWRTDFLKAPVDADATLWNAASQADLATASYVENGTPLSWMFQPSPLPDTGGIAENMMVETMVAMAIPGNITIVVTAQDIDGSQLANLALTAQGTSSLWGTMVWGVDVWGGPQTQFFQHQLLWGQPLIFKQLSLIMQGASAAGLRIGNTYLRYQVLGYPVAA